MMKVGALTQHTKHLHVQTVKKKSSTQLKSKAYNTVCYNSKSRNVFINVQWFIKLRS